MKALKFCGCCPDSASKRDLHTTDQAIDATPAELQVIRDQLRPVEELLSKLFGPGVYSRDPKSLEIRGAAANLICDHFDGIVDEWAQSVGTIFTWDEDKEKNEHRI